MVITEKLMKIAAFRRKHFTPESRPSATTVRKWIESGELPGRKIGSSWYIDISQYKEDPLVRSVIEG